MNIEQRDFVYGKKSLTVSINTDEATAHFRIGTRPHGWLHRRIRGESTAIFRLGETAVQAKADELGTPIRLTIDTANTNLKLWVLAHRADLQFDTVEPEDPGSFRITVTKTYTPTT